MDAFRHPFGTDGHILPVVPVVTVGSAKLLIIRDKRRIALFVKIVRDIIIQTPGIFVFGREGMEFDVAVLFRLKLEGKDARGSNAGNALPLR